MNECMPIPDNWKDFVKEYSFKDIREIYTNGSWLIPTFRVEQMMEHFVKPDWISVTERLPEPFKPVLGYNVDEDWYVITCYDNEEDCWWDRGYKLNDPTVDYWMPLPRKE